MASEGIPVSTAASTTTRIDPSKAPSEALPPKSRRFLVRKRKQKNHTKVTTAVETSTAAMVAAGVPRRRIAKALDVSTTTVQNIVGKPETQELITEIRDQIKRVALVAAQKVSREAWDWVEEVARAKRDPRDFDSLMRGLMAMEKLSSSASGEARRIEGTVAVDHGEISREIRELVEALRK